MTWLCPTGLAQEPTVAASRAETTGSVTYTIQAKQSQLAALMRIDTAGPLYAVAHDLVIQTDQPTGTIVWNPEDVGSCKVNLSFPVTSLQVDPGDSRAKYKLEEVTSEYDKAGIRKLILGENRLEAQKFPTVSFVSESCERQANGWTSVQGSLTMRGVEKRVKASLEITTSEGSLKAQGRFRANQIDFQMLPLSFRLGAISYKNEVEFRINVVATP